ncbi:MAG: transcriptional regulator [Armatimonadota bacterium]|nr:transcriptional regulator [Armatimonadota bacterium]MDR7443509.1 transcriptional regulator [Armatimonadota bacterium]MDR7570342.1 transcriptional regulator [Armatimonadota bacterium]MDR7615008.1 transcriptional regulator [Armatimonadota bacterium]
MARDALAQGTRLRIMAALSALPEESALEFEALRELLGLTPGNLSAHLRVLEEAGYVAVDKGYVGRRPRTWVRATPEGREAFREELETLLALSGGKG